ncbi:MAG: 5'/3'-nucleotidase SurE [Firmicutes bacterium]|nr:5'/3'-nucleotidase SurE [Bacillota bacterium]
MFVLLSNDDGIEAPGLMALAKELAPKYEAVVVAPDRERSASSHAITVHKPLRVRQINANLNIKQAYAVNGTPSDCVKLALTTLLPKQPDMVISGINRGSNLGTDVFYSGTVAAALEGLLHGIPGIAVSLATSSGDSDSDSDYSLAAQVALLVVERLANKPNIPRMLININVPDLPRDMIRGIRITRLGMRRYRNVFEIRRDPRGQTYYWLAGEPVAEVDEIDTDIAAIEDGYISLTPITVDLTDYGAIKQLQAWEKEFDI